MTGNQNAFSFGFGNIDRCRYRISEPACFTMIEHGHDAVVQFADFEGSAKKFFQIVRLVAQKTHDFVKGFIDDIVCLSQHGGVFHIGSHTFQSVEAKQISAQNVVDFFLIVIQCNAWRELNDRFGTGRDGKGSRYS